MKTYSGEVGAQSENNEAHVSGESSSATLGDLTPDAEDLSNSKGVLIRCFDSQFKRLHEGSCQFISAIKPDLLYLQPREAANAFPIYSTGELILRSAGRVEQAFGGLTINLWDDPFEWTLPEALPDTQDVLNYLEEAEAMRVRGFELLKSDADLTRDIALPSGEITPIAGLLVETLRAAAHYQGRAFATLRLLSDAKLPRV